MRHISGIALKTKGFELTTPRERVFVCTQDGYIFEKEKEHMKKTTQKII
jgi:hypothetical protein